MLFRSQLSVRAYHVGARRMLGPGWTEQVIYTGLNAAEKAREAMEPVIEAVDSNLDEFRPRRRRG